MIQTLSQMTWRQWAKGLFAAAIGGAANAVTLVVVDPATFTNTGLLLRVAGVSALVAGAFYLKQSPLPLEDDDTKPGGTD